MLPDPIPDPLVQLLAGRLRVIGEPTRIKVLDRLRRGPAHIGAERLAEGPRGTDRESHA